MILGVIGWIVAGLIVGFAASKAVNLRGDDPRLGIAAAVGGALVIFHIVRSRYISHETFTHRRSY